MTNQTADEQGTYHVLLIGIDAYERKPLHGCVSDIDSIQRLLLERAGIPAERITRLVSPHPTPERVSTVPAQPATRANIHAALEQLGSEQVGPADRVFIYYAGHGTRLEVIAGDGTSAFRGEHSRCLEALVPVDAALDGSNVLYDFELNALLAKIAERTTSVAMILDCCHSSGATRSLDASEDSTRFIDFTRGDVTSADHTISEAQLALLVAGDRAESEGTTGSVDDCQVLAACLSHELAKETPEVVAEGETRSGLLTRSLAEVLAQIPDDELITAPWARIWNQVQARIEAETTTQHAWISGGLGREWLAGPPNDHDVGLGITRAPDVPDEYLIGAGTVAGITKGARIAVYGIEPPTFPRLDEPDQMRFTDVLLEVTGATASTATAVALGEPFDLPVGVRGRLVEAGESERLPCAVVPEDADIRAALEESDLIDVTSEARAMARLERQADGSWALTDDVHGVRPDDPVLATLGPEEVVPGARSLMEHYGRYAGPVRMARRCTDLPGVLRLSLLECPTDKVAPNEFPNLLEVPTEIDASYALDDGGRFGVRIRNSSNQRLLVFLLNSDASGTVSLLGHQPIEGGTIEHFWLNSVIGDPFHIWVPEGKRMCIDRMVAIGTTDLQADLSHLVETRAFGEATRAMGAKPAAGPPWTAVEAVIRTSLTNA